MSSVNRLAGLGLIFGLKDMKTLRDEHNPANQDGHGYERCELCHYTRHPCDTYDLASDWIAMREAIVNLADVLVEDHNYNEVGVANIIVGHKPVEPMPHECESCGQSDKECVTGIFRSGRACCPSCKNTDTHGNKGRSWAQIYGKAELSEMRTGVAPVEFEGDDEEEY